MTAATVSARWSCVVAWLAVGLTLAPTTFARAAKKLPAPAGAPATVAAATPVAAKPAPASSGGASLLPGTNSKQPINIDAGKLDYFDKEQKLIYTGNVVAVQGDSTLKASVLTIFLQKDPAAPGAATPAAPSAAPGPGAGSSVRHMEADGPVTLISKDQIGTGDHATYDKAENKVYLKGNVTLSQGTNVTQGDRLVYDMTSGQAQVFSGDSGGGRVKSVFTPGSGTPAGQQANQPQPGKLGATPKHKTPKAAKGASERSGEAAAQP